MLRFSIDGRVLQVPEGATVLEAARRAGILIPTLCYHEDLSPVGGCRLCVVKVRGTRLPVAACTLLVEDGMVVESDTPEVFRLRKAALQIVLTSYVDSYPPSGSPPKNELMHWVEYFGVDLPASSARQPKFPIDSDPNPFVRVDLNKCILCTRCVRACAEIQGRFVWAMADRGYRMRLVAGLDQTLLEARCESCGACVAYCPTGALENKMSFGAGSPGKVIATTCAYCGVGCQLELNVKDNRIIQITSRAGTSVNGRHLCVKGRYGYDFVNHPDRLKYPLVREYLLNGLTHLPGEGRGDWVQVDWETALCITAQKLGLARRESGPDSIGILTSAKCTNEENYLMNKFARQVLGTNNIDHCARLCHSSTVTGLASALGSGAMTNSMDDIVYHARTIFVIGSNTTEQHPVLGAMIRQAVLKRRTRLIVADPRRIDLAEFATLHLQPLPGTDIPLLNGIMHILFANGWEDKAFLETRCEGLDEFRANLLEYPPERVAEITGVPVENLYEAAEILALNRPGALLWAMGITQHTVGVQNVLTCANLQMVLGNFGLPGSGVNPLRGQNNVQGACDMGGLPNYFPGYQLVTSAENRCKFEDAWGVPQPSNPGLTATELIPAIHDGKIRAMYILGENIVLSDPDSTHTRHALEKVDFLVLEEIFPTETSLYADVLLPGVTFAEKYGTFTNTERRVQLVRPALDPPGAARQDWEIVCELARQLLGGSDCNISSIAPFSAWNYRNTTEVMEEIASLTPIYAGVSHARLENGDRLQWPVSHAAHPGTPILHVGQFTRGKGHLIPTHHIPPAELPDAAYPMLLTTGRVIYHWHGGAMTRRARGLLEIYGQSLVEINPLDASKLAIEEGSAVRVSSRRGSMVAHAWLTERVPPGVLYANFHFPESPANVLTIAALDPLAKIPEYKVCAVRIEPVCLC